ncbi:MAG: hypothetical protein Q7T68_10700 [Sphingopyxis sp.]|nr:hypothetical protein [Sphingopyxis sp.]
MLSLLIAASLAGPDMRPVHHYRRTNGDGSEAEDIHVFVEAPDRVAVMKEKSRCTNAAYVTATLDPATGQAVALAGGRLTRAGTQQVFARLSAEDGGKRIVATVETGPRSPPLAYTLAARLPWHIYDFDFADMVAHPPKAVGARANFSFDLPLILSRDDGFAFDNRGRMHLKGATRVRHFGGPAIRYRASGAAGNGSLWFDARSGVLLEARLPLANHSEYRDFRLRLIRTRYGHAAWKTALAHHWRGCAAE